MITIMKIKTLFKPLFAISLALFLFGCKKTPHDYTINHTNYHSRENPIFKADLLIAEENFISTMETVVEPYLNERISKGYRNCTSGNKIYYESFKADNQKAVAVLFHGFNEFTDKFNEMTFYFLNMGYSVVRFDHHGHGRSTRKVANKSMITTENFQDYIDDADEIIQNIAKPLSNGDNLYLFAHSMGGGIATYYLEQHPTTFTKAALNCPMEGINCGKYGEPLTLIISSTMILFGKGHSYIPGNHDFVPLSDLNTLPTNLGKTASAARKLYYKRLQAHNEELQTSGASYYWTKSSVNASRKYRSKKWASKLETPILMFQSQNDVWVDPKFQNKIRSYNPIITLAYYPELEHEMYSSNSTYLYEYYDQVFTFFVK